MKFLIKESQLKTDKFQKLVDRVIMVMGSYCDDERNLNSQSEVEFCNNFWMLNKIEVVTVYLEPLENGQKYFDIGLIYFVEEGYVDVGELHSELYHELGKDLGFGGFKLKLLNVITE